MELKADLSSEYINIAKNISKTKPSPRLNILVVVPCKDTSKVSTNNSMDVNSKNGNSLEIIALSTDKVLINPDIPTTISKLNILEPTTFPIAIPFCPLSAAVILTAASGALVPKATIVRPIINGGNLSILAMVEEP